MLFLCAIAFFALSVIFANSRKVWLILGSCYALQGLSLEAFGSAYGSIHYFNRALIVFVACLAMMKIKMPLSRYQLIWLITTLICYLLLEQDLVKGTNIIYGDNYKAAIYGIRFFQFMGIIYCIIVGLLSSLAYNRANSVHCDGVNSDHGKFKARTKIGRGRGGNDQRNNRDSDRRRHA